MSKRDPKRDRAFEIYRDNNGNIDLVEIASLLGVPDGTVRGWKAKDKWERNVAGTVKKQAERDGTIKEDLKQVITNDKLTEKQQLFCLYFIRSFNATKSYQKAYGCTYQSAAVMAHKLLKSANVKAEIERLKAEKYSYNMISEEDIFQKFMDIAFCDMTDYVNFEHNGKTGDTDLRVNSSKEVDGTLISEVSKSRDGFKIKLSDRMKALEWLADHMNIATDEQKARIALIKAKTDTDTTEIADDGFIDALNGTAKGDWNE